MSRNPREVLLETAEQPPLDSISALFRQQDAPMPPPETALPEGPALEELRYQQAQEALADLRVTANELRGQAEQMFRLLAAREGLKLPSSSFDAGRFSGRKTLRRKLRAWLVSRLRRLRLLPSSRQSSGAARDVGVPPGCVVRSADATAPPKQSALRDDLDRSSARSSFVVLASDPELPSSRVEDFLLLAQRFDLDPTVRFVVSSRVDERYRRMATLLDLGNLEFRYDEVRPGQPQHFDVCCATAETRLSELAAASANDASFVVATLASGLGVGHDKAPEVGDIDAFERELSSILERLRRPLAKGVAS